MGKFSKISYYNIPIHVHVYPSFAQLAHCVNTYSCSHQQHSAHTCMNFLKIFTYFVRARVSHHFISCLYIKVDDDCDEYYDDDDG